MSLVNALKEFILECPVVGDVTDTVHVDTMDQEQSSMALSHDGDTVEKRYLDGSALITRTNIIYLKATIESEIEKQENSEFLDNFTDWIFVQNNKRNFPDIGSNKTVKKISAKNGRMLGSSEDGSAVYQIELLMTYFQKGR